MRPRASKEEESMRRPEIELSRCILCEVCQSASPSVFGLNSAGYMEVADFDAYPEEEVEEAIRSCPSRCISWVTDT